MVFFLFAVKKSSAMLLYIYGVFACALSVYQSLASSVETRTITVDNNCSFGVNLGFTGGFVGPTPCAPNQAVFEDRCFWDLDLSTDVLEGGESTSIQIDAPISLNDGVIWSGQLYSLQSPYIDEACPTGCGPGVGAVGTLTLSEFTMLFENLTYYDLSHVHGANIPTSFGPPTASHNSYRNGVAGGNCSWVFEPPAQYRKYLIEVKDAHGTCSRDGDCESGQMCGASFVDDTPVYGTCGKLFGYLNAHTNCIAGSQGYPFDCETYHDLFACSGRWSESGYSENVSNSENVCGCIDYADMDLESSFPCINSNPLWVDIAYPWVDYIKRACPSSYEFPFSDATSTFTSDSHAFVLSLCPGDSEKHFYQKL